MTARGRGITASLETCPPGLTAAEVARRSGLPEGYARQVLEDERERGHLERVDGRYRFTREGWANVGAPLAWLVVAGMRGE